MAQALFKVPERAGKASDSALAKRINSKAVKSSMTVRGGGGLSERINTARALVEHSLGNRKDDFILIQDESILIDYIDKSISNGIISIDTETTGLDPLQDELVGICIYTPNMKSAYIPVNHKSYITNLNVENQLPVEFLHEQFDRLREAETKVIMFNAPFDIRFLRSGINVYLKCYWDCYVGARLLNENESAGLKPLHSKYCDDDNDRSFSDYFDGIPFDLVPINLGYIYAANDAIITYELYEFQKQYLDVDSDKCKGPLERIAWVFRNIEMPIVEVVADMEDTGIKFDFEYNRMLKEKYHNLLDEREQEFHKVCGMYSDEINAYRVKMGLNCKLDDPINIGSPTQLSILLYDVIGIVAPKDKKTGKPSRSTGEKVLVSLKHPVSDAILKYREFSTIVSTFIDKLPDCVNPKDGRIHCKFNQYGADTGRFSSRDPNLQNIPSHNKDIRKMFVASDGYVLMSSDFSQQEPKCLAALCREQGDSQMYDTFMQGKDLYSEIASKAFNKPYEDCKEFREDGTTNKEGKERRTQAKSILLGVLYGRGTESIAEQLGISKNEAQEIKSSVFKGFPAIKRFEDESINMAKNYGYVTTVCGRKRRLPSMMLPDYEVVWRDGVAPDEDPLDFDTDVEFITEVPEDTQRYWLNKVHQAGFKGKYAVFEMANKEGLWIKDNTMDKDTTKVVNARIQGSAADLTKLAMIKLHESERLKELGFRMLIPVHDEIIAECPLENAKECATLLAETMSYAAEQILKMPINCDVEVTREWYGESVKL